MNDNTGQTFEEALREQTTYHEGMTSYRLSSEREQAILASHEAEMMRRFRDGVRFGLRFAQQSPDLVADELAELNAVDGLDQTTEGTQS